MNSPKSPAVKVNSKNYHSNCNEESVISKNEIEIMSILNTNTKTNYKQQISNFKKSYSSNIEDILPNKFLNSNFIKGRSFDEKSRSQERILE